MPDSDSIKVIYEPSIVRLILNRPKQLNALNDDIRKVVANTLNELMERPDIRLLVLSGEGKSFCSGADLKTTSYPKVEGDWSTRRNRTATWQRVLEQIDRIPQVTIASIQGHVVGGGALLGELDLALREQTGLAISVADESLNCVALGTGKALEYEKQLRHVIDYES